MIEKNLAGRHIIVTGAGRNVGAEVAAELARRGAKVAIVDLDAKTAAESAAAINAETPDAAVPMSCDVSNSSDVDRMVAEAAVRMGGLDGLVHSVAITDRGKTVLTIDDDEWDAVLKVTLYSTLYCSRAVGRKMVETGTKGTIVSIGSTSGYVPRGNAIAYPIAKSAGLALIKTMARQLGEHGIRVNSVTPNKVGSPVGEAELRHRPITNLIGRACEPADIAKAVAFVSSEEAGFITGIDIVVDGGALVSMSID
jgi:3-oxoacyl-[acyl-carrier protein] reductase